MGTIWYFCVLDYSELHRKPLTLIKAVSKKQYSDNFKAKLVGCDIKVKNEC